MTNTIHPYNGRIVGYNQAKDGQVTSLFQPLDPEKQKDFEQTKAVLQQTLSAMKNSKNNIAQQKKAMAQQKLIRIKDAIKSLKQMSFMDPKAVARMTARLARELASAIKEYASAGATYTEISAASSGTPSLDSEAIGQENPSSNSEAVRQTKEAETEAKQLQQEATAHQDPFQAYEKTQKFGQEEENGTRTNMIRKKDDDSPFMKDAKELLEELRNLIKTQRAKLGTKSLFGIVTSSEDEKAVREAEKALKEADKALASMTRTMG